MCLCVSLTLSTVKFCVLAVHFADDDKLRTQKASTLKKLKSLVLIGASLSKPSLGYQPFHKREEGSGNIAIATTLVQVECCECNFYYIVDRNSSGC